MVLVSPWRRTDFIQRYGLYTLQTAVQLLSSCTPRTSVHLFLFQLDETAQKVSLSWRDNCLLCCHLNFNILHSLPMLDKVKKMVSTLKNFVDISLTIPNLWFNFVTIHTITNYTRDLMSLLSKSCRYESSISLLRNCAWWWSVEGGECTPN